MSDLVGEILKLIHVCSLGLGFLGEICIEIWLLRGKEGLFRWSVYIPSWVVGCAC
jgi:hypothetical protein